jgi:hypothetical protein
MPLDDWPIRSYQSQTPPARAVPGKSGTEGVFINSMLAGGTVISGSNVDHSVLFKNVYVGDRSMLKQYLFNSPGHPSCHFFWLILLLFSLLATSPVSFSHRVYFCVLYSYYLLLVNSGESVPTVPLIKSGHVC